MKTLESFSCTILSYFSGIRHETIEHLLIERKALNKHSSVGEITFDRIHCFNSRKILHLYETEKQSRRFKTKISTYSRLIRRCLNFEGRNLEKILSLHFIVLHTIPNFTPWIAHFSMKTWIIMTDSSQRCQI